MSKRRATSSDKWWLCWEDNGGQRFGLIIRNKKKPRVYGPDEIYTGRLVMELQKCDLQALGCGMLRGPIREPIQIEPLQIRPFK